MNLHDQVKKAAASIALLKDDSTLKSVDSLEMIDLVVALEKETGIKIPVAAIRDDSFASIESIVRFLEPFKNR